MKITFICLLVLVLNKVNSSGPWCFTPPTSVNISPDKGGQNWGFCDMDAKDPLMPDKAPQQKIAPPGKRLVRIFVKTPKFDGAGAKGEFAMAFEGETGITKEITINQKGFKDGELWWDTREVEDIGGDFNKIHFRNAGFKSNDNYQCEYVILQYGIKELRFDCDDIGFSCPNKCTQELLLAGTQRYFVTIETADEDLYETLGAIYIQIIGDKAKTDLKLLCDQGFPKGSQRTFVIADKDVGGVHGVVLSQLVEDPWMPKMVTIKWDNYMNSGEVQLDPMGQKIECPKKCALTIIAESDLEKAQGVKKIEEIKFTERQPEFEYEKESFLGAELNDSERENMFEITCDTKVEGDERFGPVYAGKPNYDFFIVHCPKDCNKVGSTAALSYGIHPEQSSICKAALLDNAMPLVGGMIGIGIGSGLEKYPAGPTKWEITAGPYHGSAKSFYVYKVDNVDMSRLDVRILDWTGQPSSDGRVEFRNGGVWGSVCKKKIQDSAVKMICVTLGYADGKLRNPEDDTDRRFCYDYNGQDYCGNDYTPIHYQHLYCDNMALLKTIFDCKWEAAEVCRHGQDLIISCIHQDMVSKADPPTGTIRIMNAAGVPSENDSGRLEIYDKKTSTWGTVCSIGFTEKTAQVACKQEGYLTGMMIGKPGEAGVCKTFNNQDHCGESEKIAKMKLACSGQEKHMSKCSGSDDTSDCTHDMDTIILCKGGKGNPTGSVSEKNLLPEALQPRLGRLPMVPVIDAACDTNVNEQVFKGDPGSAYLVNCPGGCVAAAGNVYGTMIYHKDSSICRAAIHCGALKDGGGLVQIAFSMTVEKLYSSLSFEVQSMYVERPTPRTFVVGKPNSLLLHLAVIFETFDRIHETKDFLESTKINPRELEHDYRKTQFLQISEAINQGSNSSLPYKTQLIGKEMKRHLQKLSSFIEQDDVSLPQPAWLWVPEPKDLKFYGKNENQPIVPADDIAALTLFSIVGMFQLELKTEKTMTIFRHSASMCWAVRIDEEGILIFEQVEGLKFSSQFGVPVNRDVKFAITYDGKLSTFIVDGTETNQVSDIIWDWNCPGEVQIGFYETAASDYFYGAIKFLEVYNEPLLSNDIAKRFLQQIAPTPEPAKGEPPEGGDTPSSDDDLDKIKVTIDRRNCLSPCTTNPPPGNPGSQEPPLDAELGQPEPLPSMRFSSKKAFRDTAKKMRLAMRHHFMSSLKSNLREKKINTLRKFATQKKILDIKTEKVQNIVQQIEKQYENAQANLVVKKKELEQVNGKDNQVRFSQLDSSTQQFIQLRQIDKNFLIIFIYDKFKFLSI